MPSEIEIVTRGDSSPRMNAAVGRAIKRWLTASGQLSMIQQIRITLTGGPYATADEVAAFWRQVLPMGAVEDVLVDGKSLIMPTEKTQRPRPRCGGGRMG